MCSGCWGRRDGTWSSKSTRSSSGLDVVELEIHVVIHFHMLFLDGANIQAPCGKLRFRQSAPTTCEELETLIHRISHRVARFLERQGLVERDAENSYLNLDGLDDDEAGAMPDLYGHSITYRIALGPQRVSPRTIEIQARYSF